jgi:peptidase S24-like protein
MPLSPVPSEQKFSLATDVLRSFGSVRLRVTGSSMLPALWPGDLLTIESVSFSSIRPGDLACYSRDGRFFVHRLICKKREVGREVLITRGDAQTCADLPVAPELLGRVVEIRRADRVIIPSPRWRRFQRLMGLVFCRFDFVRGSALRYMAQKAKSGPVEGGFQAGCILGQTDSFLPAETDLRRCTS